jgi:hypothetical protein
MDNPKVKFPQLKTKLGRWLGIATNVGQALCYYILTANGTVITQQSTVKALEDPELPREAIASGMVGFYHIKGAINPANVLSKHWGYALVWEQLRTTLFCKGDTGASKSQAQCELPPLTERGVTNLERD